MTTMLPGIEELERVTLAAQAAVDATCERAAKMFKRAAGEALFVEGGLISMTPETFADVCEQGAACADAVRAAHAAQRKHLQIMKMLAAALDSTAHSVYASRGS